MKTESPLVEPLESRIAPATFTVTTTADSGTGSLRAELALAQAANATHPGINKIVFHLPAPLAHSENVIVLNSTLTSTGNIDIAGPGAGKLAIDGGGNYQVFNFNDGAPTTDSPVTISGLTVEHGHSSSSAGGIYSTESLTLKNVVVSLNVSTNTVIGSSVAGVDVSGDPSAGTKLTLTNCLVTGNNGVNGGGVGGYNLKSFSVTDSVLTGNAVSAGAGGAIGIDLSTASTGGTIKGCQISGNTAIAGGGVYLEDGISAKTSKMVIAGSTITGNASTSKTGFDTGGGGVYFAEGDAVVTSTIIRDNSAVYSGGGVKTSQGFGSLTISSSVITGNRTTTAKSLTGGGGVYIQGSGGSSTLQPASIAGSAITDNASSYDGGGIDAVHGVALTISHSTVSGNHGQIGGGLCTYGYNGDRVALTVTGSKFSDNLSTNAGGGINSSTNGALSISSTLVRGNIGTVFGGGIAVRNAVSPVMTNDVFMDNFAEANGLGGGVLVYDTIGFVIKGGLATGNGATEGGGIFSYDSSGSITGITITGNAASFAGGVTNGGGHPGAVTLQIAKVFANSAPSGPDFVGADTTFV
jgi:hypothetical protein